MPKIVLPISLQFETNGRINLTGMSSHPINAKRLRVMISFDAAVSDPDPWPWFRQIWINFRRILTFSNQKRNHE